MYSQNNQNKPKYKYKFYAHIKNKSVKKKFDFQLDQISVFQEFSNFET